MIWIASGIFLMIFASIFGIMLVAYIQHRRAPYDAAAAERARPKSYHDFVSEHF